MMKEAARCYRANESVKIQRELERFIKHWEKREPNAIKYFKANLDQTLSYLSLPPALHKKFRTTNLIERLFRDVRSRTKLIGSFANPVSLENYLIGIFIEVQWIQLPMDLKPFLASTDTIF